MEYEVKGDVMPILQVVLQAGESVFSESGGMSWMTDGIDMTTNSRGGIGKMIGRALSGESLFLTTYTANANGAMVTFTQEAIGNIIPIDLADGQSVILQKDSFMCAQDGVELSMHFQKRLGAGLFGGEGFILQKATGPGTVFAEVIGEVRSYTLNEGQRLKIDPGHIAMMDPTVDYDIERVKGIKNMFLSGEGIFLATLTGPGKVWLQTMPYPNLAMKVYSLLPPNPFKKNGNDSGIDLSDGLDAGDIIGGIAKNIFK